MAAKTRTPVQREHERARVAEFVLRGYTHEQIAAELGVCRQQVGYDLKVVQQRWRTSQVADFALERQRLVEENRLSRRELWAAWERGKRERKSTSTRQRKLPLPPPLTAAPEQPDGMASLVQFAGSHG